MPIETSRLIMGLIVLALLLFGFVKLSGAQTIEDLKAKINDRSSSIQQLEKEIKQYQQDIDALAQEKDSLNKTLKELDFSKKKLEADTKITEAKIASKNDEIKELSLQIGDKSERITDSKRVISQSLYNISQMNSSSMVETILSKESFSELWNNADQLSTLQSNMQDKIKDLQSLKTNLEENKKLTEKKKAELVTLQNDLKNQTKIIADTVREKNSILAETKNTEAGYRQLVSTKQAQIDAYEKEVQAFESALKIAIDPKSIPATGAGVLKWPLDKIRITQYFGNTDFATNNPQFYSGRGHNGIDLAAPIGTPIKAPADGVVMGSGNTSVGKCLSYGKWIMIKHGNGLATLYGHLSLSVVSAGQTVSTGQIIGYTGATGIATGPHLHFGVYAAEGVRIGVIPGSVNCRNVVLPLSDTRAYLNPLSYL